MMEVLAPMCLPYRINTDPLSMDGKADRVPLALHFSEFRNVVYSHASCTVC